MTVATKRVIARAFIAVSVAITGVAPPVLAILCGLGYLRSTREGRPASRSGRDKGK
jgi:hypothetical protein